MNVKYRCSSIIQINSDTQNMIMFITYKTDREVGVEGIGKFDHYKFAYFLQDFERQVRNNNILILSY